MKLPDLIKLEVRKLVHAHFQNNLSNLFFLTRDIFQKLSGLQILFVYPRYRINQLRK